MPKVQQLHHTAIVVHDLERARRFYGGVLGLTELQRPKDVSLAGTWFDCNNAQLHLIVSEETLPRPADRHFALEVEDFEDTVAALRANDIHIERGPFKRGDGSDFLVAIDPEGNTFEVTHH
jgi:catechol 2,3-dioxygenase-like lactoylglutathione lyase family enzyme